MPKNTVEGDAGLLHPNCHCCTMAIDNPVPNKTAFAFCPIEKFKGYIFSDNYDDGKRELFEMWGYDINDSEYLKSELERQAAIKYSNGEYELRKLDWDGQRIKIEVQLKKYTFGTGWTIRPNGIITNNTPYAAKREKK